MTESKSEMRRKAIMNGSDEDQIYSLSPAMKMLELMKIISKLEIDLLKAIDALKKIEDIGSALKLPGRPASYADYELRAIARETLRELGVSDV